MKKIFFIGKTTTWHFHLPWNHLTFSGFGDLCSWMLNGLLLISQLWKGFEPFVRRRYRGDTWAVPKFPSNTAGTWVQPRVVIRLPRSCFKRPVLTPISSDTTVRDTALSLHVCSITAGTQRLCVSSAWCVCRWTAAAHMCVSTQTALVLWRLSALFLFLMHEVCLW